MTTEETMTMITLQPGVSEAYGNGWRQLWKNFLELLLGVIILLAISWGISWTVSILLSFSMAGIFDSITNPYASTDMGDVGALAGYFGVMFLIQIFVVFPLYMGMAYMFLSAARGDQVKIGGLFCALSNYWNVVLAFFILMLAYGILYSFIMLLMGFIPIVGWLVGLGWFIVVIISLCKLVFVPFLLTDKNMGATEAIRTSWKWTNGHVWKVFLILLLAIPLSVAGLIVFIVGIIPVIMWVALAVASLYHAVSLEKCSVIVQPNPIIG